MIAFVVVLATLLSAANPDVVVVCPSAFRSALTPWLTYRTAQGHAIHVVEPGTTAEETRARIRASAEDRLRHVVLVGDAPAGDLVNAGPNVIPTHYRRAIVNVRWGSEADIATDQPYADVDGDGMDDVALGRIPSNSAREVSRYLDKVIRYEQAPPAAWQRKIHVVAGVGGFGALADKAIELAARHLLSGMIPASYAIHLTSASWRSPFCPTPWRFRDHALATMNEGSLYWVYLGHGHRDALDWVRTPRGAYPMLESRDAERLDCRVGSPVAVLLACYVGAFDSPTDCLAEVLLETEGGPVAVVSGTRVTMPYGNAVLGRELLRHAFQATPDTIGQLLLAAKRATLDNGQAADQVRSSLDGIAQLLSPPPVDIAAERREHTAMYHLLGDPLLRLPNYEPIRVTNAEFDADRRRLVVRGIAPFHGTCMAELATARDALPPDWSGRTTADLALAELEKYDAVYRAANDRVVARTTKMLEDGEFAFSLGIPAEAAGDCIVRLLMIGGQQMAIGSCSLSIDIDDPRLVRLKDKRPTAADLRR